MADATATGWTLEVGEFTDLEARHAMRVVGPVPDGYLSALTSWGRERPD